MVGNSLATESRHRARVSRHPERARWWGTHELPNPAIGLESDATQRGFVGRELTSYRITPLGSSQSPSRAHSLVRTHPLPKHAVGLESVAIQTVFVGWELTRYRITPSGSSQLPSRAHSLEGNSLATESRHQDRVIRHPRRIRWWRTHRLPNHTIGLVSVAIQSGFVGRELTGYRITPSGSCQPPPRADSLVGNSQAAEARHQARVRRHPERIRWLGTHPLPNHAIRLESVATQSGFIGGELTSYRITPSSRSQLLSRADSLVGNSLATESRHRARVSCHPERISWWGTD